MRPTKAVRKYLMGRFTIKSCLREGIINYSALSRKIVEAESVEGDVPATAMALRRETARITRPGNDARVFRLFKNATFSVRNRMAVLTITKGVHPGALAEIENALRKHNHLVFLIEGTAYVTIICDEESTRGIAKRLREYIHKSRTGMSLITITSPGIAQVPGAVCHLTSLFYEHEINIEEFMSCHDDTLIVVEGRHVSSVINFLHF